ncbi:MAG: hypothetical protein HLUCCO17_16525, partial [Saliniramus fredricksonii]
TQTDAHRPHLNNINGLRKNVPASSNSTVQLGLGRHAVIRLNERLADKVIIGTFLATILLIIYQIAQVL